MSIVSVVMLLLLEYSPLPSQQSFENADKRGSSFGCENSIKQAQSTKDRAEGKLRE
jgi:hypothetical protein